jgi:hypothetical protein
MTADGGRRFDCGNSIGVVAQRVAPAFGQPGGGVLFELADDGDTVRELLRNAVTS